MVCGTATSMRGVACGTATSLSKQMQFVSVITQRTGCVLL